MNLKSLKISNILTFQEHKNIDNAPQIDFDSKLNILIGTNASGKSNFLEIINTFFKTILTINCNFNESAIINHRKEPTNNSLNETLMKKINNHELLPHHKSSSIQQTIKTEIELESSDYDNLEFLINNIDEINKIMQKYAHDIPTFTSANIDKIKTTTFIEYTFTGNKKQMNSVEEFDNNESKFIFQYFHYFEFFQNIILMGNRFEKKNWKPLNILCGLISSYRSYDKITDEYEIHENKFEKLQPIYNKILLESTKRSSEKEPAIFEFVRHKLTYKLDEIMDQYTAKDSPHHGKEPLEVLKEQFPLYKYIDDLLISHLKLKLEIQKKPRSVKYKFVFKRTIGNESVDLFELSSGEKGLVHFIFSIYGFEIKNGIMIIDEPELHLHPQIQSKYLDIIKSVKDDLKIQFIIATHSPVFVNSETIYSIYRFYKENGFSQIVKPTITEPEKDLIHFLTFTNSSKIFFANKVVLVEGDNDYYFFKYYLEEYCKRLNAQKEGIEFLIIHGKGEFGKWKSFLNKYKIKTFYIGDFDNLLETSVSTKARMWKQKYGNTLLQSKIDTIKNDNINNYNLMIDEIGKKYSENLFLLQNGSLEDNLTNILKLTYKPTFDDVIKFCRNNFQGWITTSNPLINQTDYFMRYITMNPS